MTTWKHVKNQGFSSFNPWPGNIRRPGGRGNKNTSMLLFVQVIAETNAGYKNSGFQCRILNMVCVSVCGQGHISVTKLLTPYLTRRKASFEVALPPSQWRSRWVRWLFYHHSMIRCDFSVVIYDSRQVSWLAGDFSITILWSQNMRAMLLSFLSLLMILTRLDLDRTLKEFKQSQVRAVDSFSRFWDLTCLIII